MSRNDFLESFEGYFSLEDKFEFLDRNGDNVQVDAFVEGENYNYYRASIDRVFFSKHSHTTVLDAELLEEDLLNYLNDQISQEIV